MKTWILVPALLMLGCGDKSDDDGGTDGADDTAADSGDGGGTGDDGGTGDEGDSGDEGGSGDSGDEGGDEGGSGDEGDEGGDDGDELDGTWTGSIYPLMERDCLGCHEYWGADAEGVHATLSNMDSPEGGPYLVAGEPDESFIYSKIVDDEPAKGQRMPLLLPAVSAEDLELVGAWIDAGAEADVTWESEVWRVFGNYRCQQCHGGDWGNNPGDVYDTLSTGSYSGYDLISPGDREASAVYLKMTDSPPAGEPMPLSLEHWSEEEELSLRTWIEDGATAD